MELTFWQVVSLFAGIVSTLGGAVAALVWIQIRDIRDTVHKLQSSVPPLAERMAVVEYAKVSREELYQTIEIITDKIMDRIEEKLSMRDKHLSENIESIRKSIDNLSQDIRSK